MSVYMSDKLATILYKHNKLQLPKGNNIPFISVIICNVISIANVTYWF